MKFLTRFLAAIFLATILNGCYTVIWSPDMEFPNEGNSEQLESPYYSDVYYGGYYDYYSVPWWMTIAPPASIYSTGEEYTRDRNTGSIRNNNGDRGTPDRTGILDPGPPRREIQRDNDNNSNKDSDNKSEYQEVKRNNNNDSTTNSRSNNNSSNNSARNNNGSRNSGGKRR